MRVQVFLSALAVSRRSIRPTLASSVNRFGRHGMLADAFSTTANPAEYYTVGVTGSSGLVGKALLNELGQHRTLDGKTIRIVTLSRGDKAESKALENKPLTTLTWNPKGKTAEEVMEPEAANSIDAFVHLAGSCYALCSDTVLCWHAVTFKFAIS